MSRLVALCLAVSPTAALSQETPPAATPAPSTVPAVPAPEPRAALPTAQPVPTQASYRINAGDEIEVYVWGEERLQRVIRVLPDGTFSFPLAGVIAASGKLPYEIETLIADRLRDQYRGQVPQITVSVRTPSGMQFSVMGKVRSPGTFSPSRYVNLLEALSMAGGPAEFANLNNILIIRKRGDGLQTTTARIGNLFRNGATANDVASANIEAVQPGDTIIVP